MPESPTVSDLANEEFCYLTMTGRVSRLPREVEIWFGVTGSTVYMCSGGRDRSNSVRNIRQNPAVRLRIAGHMFNGTGRIVDASSTEDAAARKLLVGKYQPGYDGDLTNWGRTALPVAIDIRE